MTIFAYQQDESGDEYNQVFSSRLYTEDPPEAYANLENRMEHSVTSRKSSSSDGNSLTDEIFSLIPEQFSGQQQTEVSVDIFGETIESLSSNQCFNWSNRYSEDPVSESLSQVRMFSPEETPVSRVMARLNEEERNVMD
jgi:hypothetical protein